MALTPESNYFNTHDPTKKYFEVRALAGLVEQSREDNEIQAILKGIVQGLGNTLYKNGSIVRGGAFARAAANPNQLLMQEADVWYNGIVHTVAARTLTLTGSGTEKVGVKFTESIVTPSNDPTLRDPAVGYANYGQAGANRLKIEATWELNNVDAIPFYEFAAGVQVTQPKIGEIDTVTQTLARRTYDESGNYVVAGFDLKVDKDLNNSQIQLTVGNFRDPSYSGSKAYVQGQEIVKLVADNIPVDKALDTRRVVDERKFYTPSNPGSPTTTELRFELDSQPGAQLVRVTATFDVIRTVNSHNFNGYDEITQAGETLIDIVRVFKGGTVSSPSTTYAKSSNSAAGPGDWYRSGNGLRWDVAGSSLEPTAGDTYSVYALVRKEVEIAATSTAGKAHLYKDNSTGRTFLDISQLSPKPYAYNQATSTNTSSDIDVDYDFYLSRLDVVYVSPSGVLGVVKGAPDVRPVAPFAPGGVLSIGQISLAAGQGAARASVVSYDVKRLTMLDLRKLLNRLERAEYNQAVADLDNDGVKRAGNGISNLRGILTESFTYTADDIQTDGVDGISKIKFVRALTTNGMLNVQNRELQLPQQENTHIVAVTSSGSTADLNSTDAVTIARQTSPLFDAVVNAAATSNIQINQFDVFMPAARVELDPPSFVGRESDDTTINLIDPTNAATAANSFLTDRTVFLANTAALRNQAGFSAGTAGQKTLTSYMPQIWLWMYGQNYTPSTLVDIKVDGRPARLTLSQSVVGAAAPTRFAVSPSATITGSPSADIYPNTSYVQTNNKGEFLIGVEIPQGIPAGTIEIFAEGLDGRKDSVQFTNDASITFNATDFASILSSLDSAIKPLPPKFPTTGSTVVVKNNANNSVISDITASTTFKFEVYWDKTGGIPESIELNLSPVATANSRIVKTRSQLTGADLQAGMTTIVTSALNQAFDWRVTMTNPGGTSPDAFGTVTYNTVPPTVSTPVVGGFNVSPAPQTTGATTTTVTWSNLAGTISSLKIKNNHPQGSEYTINSPATSGSQSITVFNGVQTVTITGLGALGNSIVRSSTVTVSSPPAVWWYDPLAQSFSVAEDTFVDSVDMFFHSKPASGTSPVTLQIRAMNNGLPTASLVDQAQVTLPLASINTSSNATTATNFKFPAPVYLQGGVEYCVVLRTDSPDYRVFYSKLGQNLVGTSTPQLTQSGAGVMFTSANDSSWTPSQDSDLKMTIKGIRFQSSSLVYFNTVSRSNMVGFHLGANRMLVPGSGSSTTSPCQITWEYQLNGTGSWFPFEPSNYIYFNGTANLLQVRANFLNRQGSALTPRIAKTGHQITALTRSTAGSYVTKTASFAQAYRYVRMVVKQDIPAAGNIRWWVSDNTAQPGTINAWNSGTTYAAGAVVSLAGVNYLSLQGSNTNQNPATQTAYWQAVSFVGGVLWRELKSVGEVKTLTSDGVFYEHERTVDLGANAGRTEFRFRFDLSVAGAADTGKTPRLRDAIAITSN